MKSIIGWLVAVLATVCAAAQPNIKAGEYFVGTFDPGAGNGIAFTAVDGSWDEALESIIAQAQTVSGGSNPALFNVRLKDNANNWGPLFKKVVFFEEVQTDAEVVNISSAEFFFGNFDPGAGSGIAMPVFDNNFDEAVETVLKSGYIAALGSSPVLFNVRLRDANNAWGPVFKKVIFNSSVQTTVHNVNITQGEFYFGNFDPGAGSGTPILALDGNFDEAVETALKSSYTSSLNTSPVLFNIRFRDAEGSWGPVFKKVIFPEDVVTDNRAVNITQGEFYFGNFDPGQGSGIPVIAFDGDFNEAVEAVLKSSYTATLASSPALFNIRVKDANNVWGPVFKKTIFFEDVRNDAREMEITQAEYFFGNFDPGMGTGSPIIAFDGQLNEAVETVLRTSATWTATSGPILFNIRMRDGAGNWGPAFKKTIFPYGANTTLNLITQGDATSVCPGGSVTLNYTGPNGFTSTWFDGSSGSSITFTPTQTGYYSVSSTNGAETYSDSILVSFLSAPAPAVTPSGTILACSSSNITLATATVSGYSYQWFFNNTSIPAATSASYFPTAYGTYAVRVTDNNTTCSTTSSPTIIGTTSAISFINESGSCALPITLNASAGTGNTYQWYFNGSAIGGATGATYSAAQAGNYTVQVTNGACASTSPAVNVTGSITTPTITASGPTTFCDGGSVTLTSSAATGITWSNGATTPSIVVTESGTYSVSFSNGGCTATSTNTVVTVNDVNTAGAASANPDVCTGATITPIQIATTGATGIGNPTGLPQGLTASWSVNTITISGIPTVMGYFDYSIPLTGGCGTVSATGSIHVIETPSVTIPAASICAGQSATLSAEVAATGNYSYQWTVPSGASNPGNVASFSTTTGGTYSLVVSTIDSFVCLSTPASAVVTVSTPPTVTVNSATICSDEQATLTATVQPAGNYNYAWTTPAGVTNPGNVATFTTAGAGAYSVVASAPGNSSCGSPIAIANVEVIPSITPIFDAVGPFCSGDNIPALPTTSENGINGLWSPAINSMTTTTYTFIPNGGLCTNSKTLTIEIEVSGCTDPTALNYNSAAICDNGSCVYTGTPGCTDATACNYDEAATVDNFSCIYPGCTNVNACNFSVNAGCDDGSCTYPGCTFAEACNYDATAGCNDGSCVFGGCTDPAALNYNPTAGCDNGACVYTGTPGCMDATACNYDPSATVDNFTCSYPGCIDANACNYSVNAGCDDGSCVYPGCTFAAACNYDMTAGCNDGSCVFPGCTDPTAINYNPDAGCDNSSCVYTGVGGCMDVNACNYNPEATVDNFTCTYPGCMNSDACNYDSNAGCDDGSCVLSGCMNTEACNYDSAAGCDDGSCTFPGCTDATACNYDATAGCDDGSCLYTESSEIDGNQLPEAFSELSYSIPCNDDCSYSWDILGGLILGAEDSCVVTVAWANVGFGSLSVTVTCGDGCSINETMDVIIQPENAVADLQSTQIALYPNPTLDRSTLSIPSSWIGGEVIVHTISGVIISSINLSGVLVELDASSWAAGVYCITVKGASSQTKHLRLIKQ